MDRIDSLELMVVRMPLVTPFQTSFSVQTHREALILHIGRGDAFGWGECVCGSDPFYSYESNKTAMVIIRDYLAPILLSIRDFTMNELAAQFSRVRGHEMAKAAVENGLLDLMARRENQPLYTLIGGSEKLIPSGISIGIKENLDKLIESIRTAVNKKYHRIKIKIKKGRDVEVLKTVRKDFPDVDLMVDANADYSVDDMDILKQLDEFNLMMIEQPLSYDDLFFHARVQKALKTPICLDESIKSLNHARAAVDLGSCRIINIKQGRVGGMIHAKRIAEFCKENGIPVWSGGMLETGIGRAFNLHLQTLPGFTLPGDTSETSRYFNEDIVDKPVVLDSHGMIEIPQGPGIGVEVDLKRLEKYRTFHETLR
jgi:O-succinylbenzoate synthase